MDNNTPDESDERQEETHAVNRRDNFWSYVAIAIAALALFADPPSMSVIEAELIDIAQTINGESGLAHKYKNLKTECEELRNEIETLKQDIALLKEKEAD